MRSQQGKFVDKFGDMRITVIEHDGDAPLGFLAEWLGPACETVRPYLGEPVPERAADGLIVLGGEMAAWEDDRYPWLALTRALIARSVADGVPTLGVCLGAQLMTLACGGRVERGEHGLEVGACAVTALPAAATDRLLSSVSAATAPAVQYHRDAMTVLPEGAVLLMTGERYPNQAYRLGERAWGVQFHPEASAEIFGRWADLTDLDPGIAAGVASAEADLIATWRPVARAFADVVRASATPSR
jgi:GMP synthase (glutamine-hydrolysing)